MVKLPILKRVVLPNNRILYAKFRKITRDASERIRKTRRRCSPRAQRGRWIKIVLTAGLRLVKKLATSKIGRQLGKSAIENAPRA